MNLRGRYRSTDFQLGSIQVAFVVACISKLGGQEEVTRVERICVFLPTVPLSFFCSLYPSLFLPPLLPGTLGEREGEDGEKENDHGRGSTDSL